MKVKNFKFSDIATFKYGKMPAKGMVQEQGKFPVNSGYRYVGHCDEYNTDENTLIIVARGVGGTGDVKITKEKCYLTNLSISAELNQDIVLPKYLYYYFQIRNLRYLDSGSAQSQITINDLGKVEVPIPTLNTQKNIVSYLEMLDNKIELNNEINSNLEQQAQAIFDEYLNLLELPSGWVSSNLLDVADYLNGLAMQKYRPSDDETGLPVLKIKELRQGCCDSNSELCSENINPNYIINDGDVIFSWSGSLLVDFWCGGKCGLNQHLFKVSSTKYDKWFYYVWTKHHLNRFIAIASDMATTMGHIKREELSKATVFIPTDEEYKHIGSLLAPIYDAIIGNRLENNHLASIRDTLLPKLMSGEIDLSSIDI